MPADRPSSPLEVLEVDDDMASLSSGSASSSPTSELASLPSSPSSPSSSPTPSHSSAASSHTDVRGRPSELGSRSKASATRFAQLDKLLDQTSLYSRFLLERMPTRYQHSLNLFSTSADRRRARTQQTSAETAASQSSKRKKPSANALGGDAEEVSDERYKFLNALLAPGRSLFMYQAVGVDWLISLFENGLNGVIADEMGLGKTLQTIVFLAHLQAHNVAGPFIVIAPLSTLSSWCDECARWCPQLKVMRYHGNPEERRLLREQLSHSKRAAQTPILITSYEIAMNDQSHLRRYSWKLMVVDEGHRLKNTQSKLLTTLKSFPTENRLLLTGTPLQNNLRELWSLLNFLLPTVFDSLAKFERWFDFDSVLASEGGQAKLLERERSERLISKLHDVLHPFVLRRLKVDVLQLPPKREYVLYCPMVRVQGQWYREIVEGKLRALTSGRGGLNMRNVMMQLQKVCDCPYLVKAAAWMEPDDALAAEEEDEEQAAEPEAVEDENATLVSKVKNRKRKAASQLDSKRPAKAKAAQWSNAAIHADLLQSCGKLQVVDKTIRYVLAHKQKVLIFSGFTRMLDLLATLVDCGQYGSSYIRIDGSTPALQRGEQVKAFNADTSDAPCIALLSTRAAGLGINLASASTVVLYDTDWNPQMDAQAMDRAHRLGSQHDVAVLRLLTPASVEMSKYGRAQRKTVLTNIVMPKNKFKGEEEPSAPEVDGAGGGKGEREFVLELKEMFDREQRRLKGEEEVRPVAVETGGGRAVSRARREEKERVEQERNILDGDRIRRRSSAVDRKRRLQEEEQAAQRQVDSEAVEEAAQISEEEIAQIMRHELSAEQLAAHPLIELIDESEAAADEEQPVDASEDGQEIDV